MQLLYRYLDPLGFLVSLKVHESYIRTLLGPIVQPPITESYVTILSRVALLSITTVAHVA